MRYLLPCAALVLVGACERLPDDTGTPDTADTDTDTDTETDTDTVPPYVRLATWNIQTVGAEGTQQYEAALLVLRRIDADVIGLNEIEGDDDRAHLAVLADEIGYEVVAPTSNPFGDLQNAVLSRLPVTSTAVHDSADLSGDSQANDLTRLPVAITVDTDDGPVSLVAQHWKAGFDDDDEFRRAVDAQRTAQVLGDWALSSDRVFVVGDVNAEAGAAESPATFTSLPDGLPFSYWLGSDLYAEMQGDGLANDAFAPLTDRGMRVLDAEQLDGDDGTRPSSGRRIDYLFASPSLDDGRLATQVYDCNDEGLAGSRPLAGGPLAGHVCRLASDHLPVLVDLTLP